MVSADDVYTTSTLPPGDSPNLTLVRATPSERIESIKLNSSAWKGPLDVQTYIDRENHLSQQRLVKDGLTCWILVDRTEQQQNNKNRTILSSCETYRKRAFLAYNGRVEDVPTFGVGSVYCRPEFRGKGYARRMVEELSRKFDLGEVDGGYQDGVEIGNGNGNGNKKKIEEKRAVFSVLFSDIGKTFYAQFGWTPFQSSHISLSPISKAAYESLSPRNTGLPQARILYADDVRNCMCSDKIIQKERELLRKDSENSPNKVIVGIAPDFDHYLWHWAREEFYAEKLFPDSRMDPPVIKGAGVDAAGVYCTWNRNFGEIPQENTLFILRWVYDEPTSPAETQAKIEAMAAILRRAQFEAHQWNMQRVEFWNPTPLMLKAVAMVDPTADVVHREKSSIASLKWNGAEHGLGNDVEWRWNEKYAWC